MEDDSVHATIERRLKNMDIFSPLNYVNLINASRINPRPYQVRYFTFDFFKDFDKFEEGGIKSIKPSKNANVTNICALRYSQDGSLAFKLSFTEEWQAMPMGRRDKLPKSEPPKLYSSKRKIKKSKFDHLQQLKAVLSAEVCNMPGSVHDARILWESALLEAFERPHKPIDGIILGDSGYMIREWLLTPLPHVQTAPQEQYNYAHSATRTTIERCIGVLKRRFHSLHTELRLAPPRVCKIVSVCMMLHNFAIRHGNVYDSADDIPPQPPGVADNPTGARTAAGKAVRDRIVREYFSRRELFSAPTEKLQTWHQPRAVKVSPKKFNTASNSVTAEPDVQSAKVNLMALSGLHQTMPIFSVVSGTGSGLLADEIFYDKTIALPLDSISSSISPILPDYLDSDTVFTYHQHVRKPLLELQMLEKETMSQSTPKWHQEREKRITASRVHEVLKTTDPHKLCEQIFTKKDLSHIAPIQLGKRLEPMVKNTLRRDFGDYIFRNTGLVVHPDYPFLGASPDGLLFKEDDSMIVEGVGLCPSMLKMVVHLRSGALKEHEKYVTLSLDGMTIMEGLTI
ncbi:hypothetical protein EGW08_018732 [Elysia chlorotica]|uniref:DDE Tnp4 domain-containing protein n=1 Tax=Elysia chlorotica TaxID=188477 RepID=A0A3S1B101_ELYCH|nr:hypothetical protein EGW08_018732 [Elysia chlorotica]